MPLYFGALRFNITQWKATIQGFLGSTVKCQIIFFQIYETILGGACIFKPKQVFILSGWASAEWVRIQLRRESSGLKYTIQLQMCTFVVICPFTTFILLSESITILAFIVYGPSHDAFGTGLAVVCQTQMLFFALTWKGFFRACVTMAGGVSQWGKVIFTQAWSYMFTDPSLT